MQQTNEADKQSREASRKTLMDAIEKSFSIPDAQSTKKEPESQSLNFTTRVALIFAIKNAIQETIPHTASFYEADLNIVFDAIKLLTRRTQP